MGKIFHRADNTREGAKGARARTQDIQIFKPWGYTRLACSRLCTAASRNSTTISTMASFHPCRSAALSIPVLCSGVYQFESHQQALHGFNSFRGVFFLWFGIRTSSLIPPPLGLDHIERKSIKKSPEHITGTGILAESPSRAPALSQRLL